MSQFYWPLYALILILGRLALLCGLYFCDAPTGGPFVSDWNRFLWHTLFAEIGFAMALALFFFAISTFLRGKGLKIVKIASAIVATLYFFACGIDDEVMRWMNQRLTLSFLGTYLNATSDMGLVLSIVKGGIGHLLLTTFLGFSAIAASIVYAVKMPLPLQSKGQPLFSTKKIIALSLTVLFAALGCTSHMWFNPSHRRWPRIKPVAYVFAEELVQKFATMNPPEHYREGITALGGNPDQEFPFWHIAANESESLEAFKKRPLEERPDIILFTIESLRGWTSDMRIEANCKRFPNLCKLAYSGYYAPNAHSVGYPSIEGFLGIMVGVYSTPSGTFLYDFPNTQMRSFPDILADAGYHRELLCGSDPSFDNEKIWQEKWFDFNEFKPENDNDVALARRFVELYRERPQDKPLLFHWMSRSMHIPFTLPEDMGETPESSEDAYVRAEAYMDSALGIVLNEIYSGPRANNTLIILTGDHSYPNMGQTAESEQLGKIHDGATWVNLIFAGAGIQPYLESRPVSQADISPSIMGFLKLDVSNHFVGQNLLDFGNGTNQLPTVYSFRQGEVAMRTDSLTFFAAKEGADLATVHKNVQPNDWDSSKPVEGFISGATAPSPAALDSITKSMQYAAQAWEYIVFKNKLKPIN
ncbi:MAG: sulfatase-like hydrolase/transferase [Fibrobacter sp.]|nr:sulfatase-like hydrolase/transferase [Fibrobacter sp.]